MAKPNKTKNGKGRRRKIWRGKGEVAKTKNGRVRTEIKKKYRTAVMTFSIVVEKDNDPIQITDVCVCVCVCQIEI